MCVHLQGHRMRWVLRQGHQVMKMLAVAKLAVSGQGASPEQVIIREVQDIINSSDAVEVEHILNRGGQSAACLQTHVESRFLGTTEEVSRMKFGDWTLYCKLMYTGSIPEITDVVWPPASQCWVRFLFEARVRVSSYKRFQGVVGNVCEVADRFWSKELRVLKESVDPRVLYSAEHSRAMHTIKREHDPHSFHH